VHTLARYGDLVPTTEAGRLFAIFYSFAGISIVGALLGYVGGNIVEAERRVVHKTRSAARAAMMELFRPGKEREVSKHARQRLMRLRHAFRLKKRKGDDGTALNGGRLPRLESLRKILSPVFAIRTRSDSSKSIIRRIFDTIAQSYYVLVPFVTLALFIGNQEGWTIITSIYYAMATASTVGWGDMAPTHPKMRVVGIHSISCH